MDLVCFVALVEGFLVKGLSEEVVVLRRFFLLLHVLYLLVVLVLKLLRILATLFGQRLAESCVGVAFRSTGPALLLAFVVAVCFS